MKTMTKTLIPAAFAACTLITSSHAATITITTDSNGGALGTLGSTAVYDDGTASSFNGADPLWGDVTATAERTGFTYASFSVIDTLDAGNTIGSASTIEAGTYTIQLQLNGHTNKPTVAYLDLSGAAADTTTKGFTFGIVTTVATSAAAGSEAITAFNNLSGVTFTVNANPTPAQPGDGETAIPQTWEFQWDIAEGSAAIGETAYVGTLIQHMKSNAMFVGDGSIEFTAVPEPSSTALLGLGGLALILRRRK